MMVIRWEEFLTGKWNGNPLALTIGVFDGVHRGHRVLVERLQGRGIPTAITFLYSPKRFLGPDSYEGDIVSLAQKLSLLEDHGVERAVLIDFSGDFSTIKGRDFINLVKSRSTLAFMAVGINFRCGHGLDTGAAEIQDWFTRENVPVDLVPPVLEGGEPVSSSRIRALICAGDFSQAALLLGRKMVIGLSDLRVEQGKDGSYLFDFAASFRVCPPPGRYDVLVHGKNMPGGKKVEISVRNGKVFVPSPFEPDRIEF